MKLTVEPWRTEVRFWHARLHRWVEAGELIPACLEGPGLHEAPGLWLATYGNAAGGSDSPLVAALHALANAASYAQESA